SNKIYDYNYKGNTYFFLDHKYRYQFAEARTSLDLIQYDPADSIVVIEVYEDDGIQTNDTREGTLAFPGTARPMNLVTGVKGGGKDGFFHRLEPQKDYYLERSLGFIVFRNRIPDTSTIAVYMKTKSGNELGQLSYDPDKPGSRMDLKLIKPKSQRPTDVDTWDLEWKNVYDLGQTNIDPEGLEIRIYRDTSDGAKLDTQGSVPIIHILGLDQQDEFGNRKPDNKVDLNRSFVDLNRGELVFPLLRPFDARDSRGEPARPDGVNVDLNPKVPKIYESQNQQEKVEASKYYIEVKTASRQSTIRINSSGIGGIMEGTERVTLNGKVLSRGTDYDIVYQTGEVILRNKDALSPTAQLDISYEEENALRPMQKSLMGLRSEYEFWGNSRIGGVFLFNNESTTDKRVKLGQEPSRTMLFDTDALINVESQFLTRMVDKLPMVIADQKSTLRFEGELARSLPNMNTKGVVYVDDFEGTQNTPVGIGRTNWTLSSAPDPATTGGLTFKRGRIQWYNPWERIRSKDIWPKKETSAEENTIHVLNLGYGKAEGVSDNESFAGIMSAFYGSGIDMSRSRFIEVWAKGSRGKLKIDIGSISEDWFPIENPNGLLDTEDKPIPGQGRGDGILTVDEDTGLDGLLDAQESGYSASNTDPDRDNFFYKEKDDYTRINGAEGNRFDSDRMGLPDTEDVNGNGVLDTKASYYEYTIGLDDPFDPYLVPDSVPTGNPGGWRLFRIPLWNNAAAVLGGAGAPDSTLIEYARLWVTGCDSTLIQIASMEIIESNWLEDGIFDSQDKNITATAADRVRITRVNTDENLEYNPPPGVSGEIDRNTKVRRMEQSLVIEAEGLSPGNSAFIYRNFGEKMDFTDYTALKMFVHGPDDFPDPASGASDMELVMRFGADRDNYYEYRTPVYRGWAAENTVEADFAACTALKLKKVEGSEPPVEIIGNKTYTLKGDPNLQNVKIVSIGIRNRQTSGFLSARVWLDELRMDALRDMSGAAARASITTDLAGFANLTTKIQYQSADFHGMNTKKGMGDDKKDWQANLTVNMDRFTPKRWNLSLPVIANMGRSSMLPRLKSGSDIILNDQQKEAFSSGTFDQSYSVSYRKNSDPSQKGVMKHLLNWGLEKWNASYTWGENNRHDPLSGWQSDWKSQGKFTYNVNPKGRSYTLFGWMKDENSLVAKKLQSIKLGYTPNQLSYDLTYDDRFSFNDRSMMGGRADTTKTRVMNERINFAYDPLENILKYQYTQSKTRDLFLKLQTDYTETNRITFTGPKFGYLTNNYNYDVSYAERNNPRYSLSSQVGGRQVQFSKRFSIDANLEWGKMFEDFSGKPKPVDSSTDTSSRPQRDMQNAQIPEEKQEEKKEEEPQPKEVTTEPEKPKEPGLRTKAFLAVSTALSPLTFRYSNDNQLSYAGITDRPGFLTRFGVGGIAQPDSNTVMTRQNTESGSQTLSLETSVKLPLDIGISASVDINSRNTNSISANTRTEGATLPDLDFTWNNIDSKLKFLKKAMNNISLSSRFSVKNEKEWLNESVLPTSDKSTTSYSPLLNLSGILWGGLQSSFSVSKSSETNNSISGSTASTSISDRSDASATFRYTVSPSSGILQKLNLKSSIDLQMGFNVSQNQQRRSIEGKPMAVVAKGSSWSISPKADYRFSQKFTGTAMVRIEDQKDGMTSRVRKVREVSISGRMTF
ncbi:MAG: T9SS outer membrane translocon Sov/SprA, partial [Candidatus Latescibacterota bacterium]